MYQHYELMKVVEISGRPAYINPMDVMRVLTGKEGIKTLVMKQLMKVANPENPNQLITVHVSLDINGTKTTSKMLADAWPGFVSLPPVPQSESDQHLLPELMNVAYASGIRYSDGATVILLPDCQDPLLTTTPIGDVYEKYRKAMEAIQSQLKMKPAEWLAKF